MEWVIIVLITIAVIILLVGLASGHLLQVAISFMDAVKIDITSNHSKQHQTHTSSRGPIQYEEPLHHLPTQSAKPQKLTPLSFEGTNTLSPVSSQSTFMSDEDMINRFAEYEMNK